MRRLLNFEQNFVEQLNGKYYRIYVGDALVHKMQGTSVYTVAVNFWDRNYLHLEKHMCYVALSRGKSLNGLHLDKLDYEKLTQNTANTDALKEMEKL
jgi:ATP-dependent exoDNAse (exonuclease V) alpha subunit